MSKGNSSKPAVAVIGAGMGGMATAARLAKAGHQVTIYEASDRHGVSAVLNGSEITHSILVLRY